MTPDACPTCGRARQRYGPHLLPCIEEACTPQREVWLPGQDVPRRLPPRRLTRAYVEESPGRLVARWCT